MMMDTEQMESWIHNSIKNVFKKTEELDGRISNLQKELEDVQAVSADIFEEIHELSSIFKLLMSKIKKIEARK